MQLTIGHLYGKYMNTYGDDGNIIVLRKRGEWRNIMIKVIDISLDHPLKPGECDLYFFGGGQDQAQKTISEDLIKNHKQGGLVEDVERGVPLLAICGGYQLLGEYYQPHQGPKLKGLALFPAYTQASYDRMIGNLIVEPNAQLGVPNSVQLPSFVGFENHSGKTYLREGATALGKVIKGFGNNGEDQTEGCLYKNAIGCYLHGSLLPKNPELADWLIQTALEVKYEKKIALAPLDDQLEIQAHQKVISMFS